MIGAVGKMMIPGFTGDVAGLIGETTGLNVGSNIGLAIGPTMGTRINEAVLNASGSTFLTATTGTGDAELVKELGRSSPANIAGRCAIDKLLRMSTAVESCFFICLIPFIFPLGLRHKCYGTSYRA